MCPLSLHCCHYGSQLSPVSLAAVVRLFLLVNGESCSVLEHQAMKSNSALLGTRVSFFLPFLMFRDFEGFTASL